MSGPNNKLSRLTLVRFYPILAVSEPFYPFRTLLDPIGSAFSIALTTGASYSLTQGSPCPELSEPDATACAEFINGIPYPPNRTLITASYCPLQSIGHCR